MPEIISRNPSILLVFLALAAIEWLWRARYSGKRYDLRASAASVGVAIGQFLLKPLTAGVVAAVYGWLYDFRLFDLPASDWRTWLAAFIGVEFAYFWFHRLSHTTNWFWATHAVHHSANELTLPAAIRLGWTGPISGVWLFFTPLILLGFPPLMVAGLLGANLIYQFLLHTEAVGKLWVPAEFVLNTPSHHRVHHAANPEYLDKNFGGVIILFDRLFGTFAAEADMSSLRYGLVRPLQSYNPFRIALHQWILLWRGIRAARGWRARFAVLAAKPATLET